MGTAVTEPVCEGCGAPLGKGMEATTRGRGRPARYCNDACRARAYRARKTGRRRALPAMAAAHLVLADARRLPLPDASVDLIVTSPPYFAQRSYGADGEDLAGQIGCESSPEEYLEAMWACTAEWARVLKPSGSMFVLLGDKYHGAPGGAVQGGACGVRSEHDRKRGRTQYAPKRHKVTTSVPTKSLFGMPWRYAIGCVDRLGLVHRAEMIWHKPNPMPESVADRVVRAHETVFHFTRSPKYWHDPEHARLPSVWTVPTTPLKVPAELEDARHFAAMPEALPRRLILGYAPPLGIVLDPFGGTGTTAAAAKALGRVGISSDLSPAYTQLAAWRSQTLPDTVRRRAATRR